MAYADTLQSQYQANIAILFLQILFILSLCRIVGRFLQIFKQPPVVGEIIAGIIMGPTCLGQSASFTNFMFPSKNAVLLKGISDLGITFFMFILGLEFAPADMLRGLKKTWMIGVAGIILPFALGAAIAGYLYDATGMVHHVPLVTQVSFILFTGASMSFTAFPVLARILSANNAMTAQIGLVSMGVASVDDLLAWTVLAIATSVASGGSPQDGAWGIMIGVAWVIFLMVVVRKALSKLQPVLSPNNYIVLVFLGMCISAWITQTLGLHAFFGGFIFGLTIPKEDKDFVHNFIDQLEVVVVNFFVPLFFANTGLRTDLTELKSSAGPVLLVLLLATLGKMIPPFFLGRCRGYSWRFSFQLASLMNARGLIALIALEVAQAVGAFNQEMYSIFVVMALGTTILAGPMFWVSYRRDLDPPTSGRELAAVKLTNVNGPGTDQPSMIPRQPSVHIQTDVPELEDIAIREESVCHELPVEEQLVAPTGPAYGYLFHGTFNPPSRQESRRSVLEAFSFLQPKTPHNAPHGSPTTTAGPRLRHNLSDPDYKTPKFDALRSPSTPGAEHMGSLEETVVGEEPSPELREISLRKDEVPEQTAPHSILRTMSTENKKNDEPEPRRSLVPVPSVVVPVEPETEPIARRSRRASSKSAEIPTPTPFPLP